MKFEIEQEWDGTRLPKAEHIEIEIHNENDSLDLINLHIHAPFHNDPAPQSPEDVAHLWDFEVVEVFFLGHQENYLEIEMNP